MISTDTDTNTAKPDSNIIQILLTGHGRGHKWIVCQREFDPNYILWDNSNTSQNFSFTSAWTYKCLFIKSLSKVLVVSVGAKFQLPVN